MLNLVKENAKTEGIENISVQLAELGASLAIADQVVDNCLLSTVLHMPGLDDRWGLLFSELHRILRRTGRLGIVESYPADAASERPLHLRLTPETVVAGVEPHGFKKRDLIDLDSSYFVLFERL